MTHRPNRRDFIQRTAAVGASLAAFGATAPSARAVPVAQPVQASGDDLTLVNGRIHTFDPQDSVVSSVSIHNGRIAAVDDVSPADGSQVIDLQGRTVVPGLVDNHNHIVLLGLRPGFDTRLENAASVADVQAILRQRAAQVPANGMLTAIGGWNPAQFAEKRLPSLAELDSAVSDRPVYLQVAFAGPSTTNSAGKQFFEAKGVTVGDDGSIAANDATLAA